MSTHHSNIVLRNNSNILPIKWPLVAFALPTLALMFIIQ